MSRVILAIVALLIGVAIGFFLGSGSSDGAPEVGAAARVARSSDPEAPAPLPAHAAPRIGERETPPAQAATPSPKREDAVSVAEDPENEVPSAEIRGVVRLSSGEPAERAIITCRRADARVPTTTEVIQRGDELSLPDGARVRATKSGRFAIFGLTPGMGYRLTARGDAKLDYNFVEHVEAAGVDVVAPAADVVLPLDQPTLELEFVVPPNRLQGPPQELYFDVEKFVRVYPLAVPAGFTDARAFNVALAEELARLHTTKAEPLDQTLRQGTQTPGLLFSRKGRMIEQVREQIRAAVSDYIDAMEHDEAHPLLSRKQSAWSFTHSWSCKLRSSGYHTNHVHPMGWISSAYYVSLPSALDDASLRQGWLKFGESHLELGDGPEHYVRPRVGHLVLFPSYFWHGTVPFESQEERLTIAFDVVPGEVDPRSIAAGPY